MKSSGKGRLFFSSLCVIFMTATLILTTAFYHVRGETSKTFTRQSHITKKVMSKKPVSILVMGTDVGALNRGNVGGNTDTLELITVNPQKKTILLMSIPRDTMVEIDKRKSNAKYAKINSAYQVGGPRQTVKQVKELLNVPIDYYAVINMGVLKKVVNTVGGVNVDNPFAFDYEGHHFPKGQQHLNGDNALKYSRMRYDDPNNDYGRQKRQQQIIISVIDQFKHHASAKAADSIIQAVGDGVKTNVPINDIEPLYDNYHTAMAHVKTDHLQGEDANYKNVSYQMANPKEIRRAAKAVRKQLGLSSQEVVNNETDMYTYKDNLEELFDND